MLKPSILNTVDVRINRCPLIYSWKSNSLRIEKVIFTRAKGAKGGNHKVNCNGCCCRQFSHFNVNSRIYSQRMRFLTHFVACVTKEDAVISITICPNSSPYLLWKAICFNRLTCNERRRENLLVNFNKRIGSKHEWNVLNCETLNVEEIFKKIPWSLVTFVFFGSFVDDARCTLFSIPYEQWTLSKC